MRVCWLQPNSTPASLEQKQHTRPREVKSAPAGVGANGVSRPNGLAALSVPSGQSAAAVRRDDMSAPGDEAEDDDAGVGVPVNRGRRNSLNAALGLPPTPHPTKSSARSSGAGAGAADEDEQDEGDEDEADENALDRLIARSTAGAQAYGSAVVAHTGVGRAAKADSDAGDAGEGEGEDGIEQSNEAQLGMN